MTDVTNRRRAAPCITRPTYCALGRGKTAAFDKCSAYHQLTSHSSSSSSSFSSSPSHRRQENGSWIIQWTNAVNI